MEQVLLPLKHVRIQQLASAGFNVADSICFPPGKLDPVLLKEFFNKYKDKNGISLRHFHEDEVKYFKCPVAYEQKNSDLILQFLRQHNQMYYSLVNEAIPLSGSRYAGCALLLDQKEYVVEYFEGPGTPRDTETRKDLKWFRSRNAGSILQEAPLELRHMAARFEHFLPRQRPIIIEFNIYPYPVGKRSENLIVWEWRRGFAHAGEEMAAYYYAKWAEAEATIASLMRHGTAIDRKAS